MKKKILSILCAAVLVASLLTGCGGSGSDAMYNAAAPGYAGSTTANSKAEIDYDSAMDMEYVKTESTTSGRTDAGETGTEQKLIYTATLEMETTAFDDAVAALAQLVERYDGYFSTNNVRNYSSGYRSADYVIRIPAENYEDFLAQAGELCRVLRRSSTAEDVSEEYYDLAGRLKTQQTKLARLQELLTKAESMEDIITIESAISETEMQIEYLSGTLQHYDALVDYSTVNIGLQEVYRLSNTEEPVKGFGSRFTTALKSGWENFISGLEDMLISLAYSWMWVLIWGVVIILVIRAVRRRRKSGDGRKLFRGKDKAAGNGDHTEQP